MTAPQHGSRYPAGAWGPGRLVMIVAVVFFSLSALAFAFATIHSDIGNPYAWLAAGFAACALSWALP